MPSQEVIKQELNHLRIRIEFLERSLTNKPTPLAKKWYSPQEAADFLGISKALVLRMADAGKLEYWKSIGGHRKIFRESLDSYIDEATKNNVARAIN